jgi:ParB family chromosome partitioning protein
VSKERRLGRGLAALLGAPLEDSPETRSAPAAPRAETVPTLRAFRDEESPEPASASTPEGGLLTLNVYEIDDNPFQPRRDFSEPEIASLAESLKEHDMLQPILVRKVGERYQLISGERRLRAAIQAGWQTVPARLREADDRLVAELAIVENLQRKDLNPIEKALSFQRYLDQHGCPQDELARRLKLDRSTIANLLRLLELPETVRDALRSGLVSAGHARALLPLGDESEQITFCRRIESEGLSVRDVERLVQERVKSEDEATNPIESIAGQSTKRKRTKSEQTASLEQELRVALGARVEIKLAARGRGKLIVHFANADEFERLRGQLTDTGASRKGQVG